VRQLTLERREQVEQWLDAMPDAVLVVDAKGRILFVSAQAEAMFGYPREDLLGREIEMLLPERLRPAHRTHRGTYARAPVTRSMGTGLDLRARRRDGSEFPVDVSLSAVVSEGRQMIVTAVRDVTERAAMLDMLRRSEERYRMVVENASEVFYRVSIEDDPLRGRLEFVSPQCESMTGHSPEEFTNNPSLWIESIHPEDRAAVAEATTLALSSKAIGRRYYRLRDRGGRDHWMADEIVPIVDPQGKVTGYQGVARDITERMQANEQRRTLEAQLAQSRRLDAIGQLAGGVAHDFNNLLTVIVGLSCDLLERPAVEIRQDVRTDIEMILGAGERAALLTQQLLAFSRRQIVRPVVLDLNAVVAGLEAMLRRLIEEDIEFSFGLAPDLGRVRADVGQIEQVVINLVVNARDAMPTGGTLIIETANAELDAEYARTHASVVPGRYVMLAVSDTGSGMPPEVQARLFEPFFTTKEGRGTGLGLATVYGIVKQSGGSIWVYSEPNKGTTLKVYLPLVDEPVAPAEPPRGADEQRLQGTETVLIVVDDEAVRAIARRALTRAGYTVLEASSAEAALRVAAGDVGTVHLLLTDVVMPGMSGRTLAQRLGERHPNMRVVYMSGYTDNAIVHHGVLEPGFTLLQKPFTPNDVSRLVRAVLDTPPNRQADS
jgi:PAS domain S-box-containing protein